MIKLSCGKHELGFWPSVQEACDFASNYLFLREVHHKYNWEEIRLRAPTCEKGVSVSVDGLMFEKVHLYELDDFDVAAIDMAIDTEFMRREFEQKEHPEFDRASWKMEVERDDTQLGYWEWVVHQTQAK